jgi:hypothetical protein
VINVTIDNRCNNIELTSPVYFTKNTTCNVHPSQQVDFRNRMKVSFRTGMDQDTFGGALLYHLKGKDDVSVSAQLLVIWGWNSYRLYSHVRLIEHENTLVWDKSKLKALYAGYDSQYDIDVIIEEWFLDDNKRLKTVCETSRGGLEMNIIISEEKDLLSCRKPLWVDSER